MAASICSEASSVAGDLEGTAAAMVNLRLDLGFGGRREGEGAGEMGTRGTAAGGGLLNHKQGKAATRGAGARRRHGASAHVATVREERERTDRRVPLADFYTFCKVPFQLKPVAL